MVKEIVVTISGERNERMNEMTIETAKRLRSKGYFFVSCHRGERSSATSKKLQNLADKCEFFPTFVFQKIGIKETQEMIRAVGEQIKKGFSIALKEKPEVIIYTEGDKYTFVDKIPQLSSQVLNGDSDIAIATRSKQSFRAFPLVQRVTENLFNIYTDLRTRLNIGDYVYGPKAFSPRAAQFVLEDCCEGWGTIIYPIVEASRRGMKVSRIEVDGFPPEGYMEKYGQNFGHMKHIMWRVLQGMSNLSGFNQKLD